MGSIPSWDDPMEKGMTTHWSILAWKIPQTAEPGGYYSPWSHKELDMTEWLTLSLSPTWINLTNKMLNQKEKVAENIQCVHAQSLQSYLTLCDRMDCSPPGSSVHGILPVRILEWVTMPSSRGSSWHRHWTCVSDTAGRFFTTGPPGKPIFYIIHYIIEYISL